MAHFDRANRKKSAPPLEPDYLTAGCSAQVSPLPFGGTALPVLSPYVRVHSGYFEREAGSPKLLKTVEIVVESMERKDGAVELAKPVLSQLG
jgi:hypothetical protein